MNLDEVNEKCYFLADNTVLLVEFMIKLYWVDSPINFLSITKVQLSLRPLGIGFITNVYTVVLIVIYFGNFFNTFINDCFYPVLYLGIDYSSEP